MDGQPVRPTTADLALGDDPGRPLASVLVDRRPCCGTPPAAYHAPGCPAAVIPADPPSVWCGPCGALIQPPTGAPERVRCQVCGVDLGRTTEVFPDRFRPAAAVPSSVEADVKDDPITRGVAEEGIRALLTMMGDNPNRDGLADTPARFVRALLDMTTSTADPATLLAVTFGDVDYPADQMVAVGPVSFVSLCEHHLLPFPGTAWIAYVPADGRVVGLSKLPRLLDHYAARPQVQERLTTQVADAIMEHARPLGAAVMIRAEHGCMAHRGVRKPGAAMVTAVMRGVFLDQPETRAEFLALTRSG